MYPFSFLFTSLPGFASALSKEGIENTPTTLRVPRPMGRNLTLGSELVLPRWGSAAKPEGGINLN